jgi:hypothetical protein
VAQLDLRDHVELAWGLLLLRIRIVAAAVAAVAGVGWLAGVGQERSFGWALVAFSVFTTAHVAFDVALVALDDGTSGASLEGKAVDLISSVQSVVLTLTGTTLGLLAAFTEGPLSLAVRASVVSLVGAGLVQLAVHASGARLEMSRPAFRLGAVGDVVALLLFSFGLAALGASVVVRG